MTSRRTCALVSTAGGLLAKRDGASIDAHDVIIRTGTAPIHRFEKHVGRRTHFRVMSTAFADAKRSVNITSLKRDIGNETLVYVNDGCQDADNLLGRRHRSICFRPSPCLYLVSYKKQYSTGLAAFLFSFQRLNCASTTLYGFNTTLNERYTYHYWSDGSVHDHQSSLSWYDSRQTSGHEFRNEHRFYRTLANDDGRVDRESFDLACGRVKAAFDARQPVRKVWSRALPLPRRSLSRSLSDTNTQRERESGGVGTRLQGREE